jgi:hypothetical protein
MGMSLSIYIGPFVKCARGDNAAYTSVLGDIADDYKAFRRFERHMFLAQSEGDAGGFEGNHLFLPNRVFPGGGFVHSDGFDVLGGNSEEDKDRFLTEFADPISELTSYYGHENVQICYGVVRYYS